MTSLVEGRTLLPLVPVEGATDTCTRSLEDALIEDSAALPNGVGGHCAQQVDSARVHTHTEYGQAGMVRRIMFIELDLAFSALIYVSRATKYLKSILKH